MPGEDDASEPRRLVYLITEDWFFTSHFIDRALAARAAGYDVRLVTRDTGEAGRNGCLAGLELTDFQMDRRGLNPFALIREAIALIGIYRRIRPDIVHHIALRPIIVGGLASLFCHIRLVVNAPVGMGYLFTASGWKPRLARGIVGLGLRFLLRRKNAVTLTENREDGADLTARFTLSPDRVRLIEGAGVKMERFEPARQARAARQDGPVTIMLAARLLREKGVEDFVAAARTLREHGATARFVLVGAPDPDNPGTLSETRIMAWRDAGIVEWWGHSTDMAKTLASADIFCLPSYYREGLPKVLLEAAAAGCALITSDIPGCRAVVSHGETGLLVPPRDAAALALEMRRLIDDPILRQRLAENGFQRVVERFSNPVILAQTLAVYDLA